MKQSPSVAVVGAGLSGLACAGALQAAGWAVRVFDKSRGPSGRMSTRLGDGWQCDHGAQYFTARDPRFRAELARWQAAGVAAPWQPRLRVVGDEAGHGSDAALQRFVGTPGMRSPGAWLLGQLPHTLGFTASGLDGQDGWRLASEEAHADPGRFDAVVLALPAPQAARLLAAPAPSLAELAQGARMRGCWALMLRYAAPIDLPFDAAFVNRGPLRWVARDSSKPGRPAGETWLLHATPEWSEAHLEDAPEAVAPVLLEAFAGLGAPHPAAWTAHRWRYADTASPLQSGCCWDAGRRIGLCGDWLHGGRVEGAWLSGLQLAQRMLGTAPA